MLYDDAVKKLEEILQKNAPSGTTAKVYAWDTHRTYGVRIAEISFFSGLSGCSFMQTDVPHGLAVCAQAERVVISMMGDWDDDGGTDGADEIGRLEYLLQKG